MCFSPQGSFEGNLSRYDGDGVLVSRQPNIVHIYDPTKKATSIEQVPSTLNARLCRCTDQTDVVHSTKRTKDLSADGLVCDDENGHFCSSYKIITTYDSVIEQCLNLRDEQTGKIVARARLITVYRAGYIKTFVAFREQPSSFSPFDEKFPTTLPGDVGTSDLVGTNAEASIKSLCGKWRGQGKLFSLAIMSSTQPIASQSGVTIDTNESEAYWSVANNELTVEVLAGNAVNVSKGSIAENNKSISFWDGDLKGSRLVFLGGGIVAHTSTMLPSGNNTDLFFVELMWLAAADLRLRVRRVYSGTVWTGTFFFVERKI